MDRQVFKTRSEAADYITEQGVPCTKGTLQKLASTGGGPAYQLFGNRTLYTTENLDSWIDEKLSAPRRSTSDVAKKDNGQPACKSQHALAALGLSARDFSGVNAGDALGIINERLKNIDDTSIQNDVVVRLVAGLGIKINLIGTNLES